MNITRHEIDAELSKLKDKGAKILDWRLAVHETPAPVRVTLVIRVRTYILIPYRGTKVKEEEIRIALA